MKDQMTHAEAISVIAEKQEEIESLRQQLEESQARERRRAELAFYAAQVLGSCDTPERWTADKFLCESVSMPSDSTALDEAIRQAKREALLEAAKFFDTRMLPYPEDHLRRMADEVKTG